MFCKVSSQTTMVKSFHWIETSKIKDTPLPNLKLNIGKCAKIKVVTRQMGYSFDFGNSGKPKEIVRIKDTTWLWVPSGATAITLTNKSLNVKYNYTFGQELEEKEVYVMELNSVRSNFSRVSNIESQWLNVLDKFYIGAEIYCDDVHIGHTPYFGSFPFGIHKLRLEGNEDKKDTTINISKETGRDLILNLRPIADTPSFGPIPQAPEFPGGYEAMTKFISDNIQWTEMMSEYLGTNFLRFEVSETGKISNIKILRGLGYECDKEAIRIVKLMPKWIPGRLRGNAIPTVFNIPVRFHLSS